MLASVSRTVSPVLLFAVPISYEGFLTLTAPPLAFLREKVWTQSNFKKATP